jgi:hypothetical protein
MAENKTKETDADVNTFLDTVTDDKRKQDAKAIVQIMKKATGFKPKMWGSAIIGFGSYHYVYESGREGDAPLVGFSPRKDAMALYLGGMGEQRDAMLKKLGKHKAGKGCVYVKSIEDINKEVLTQMVMMSVKHYQEKYPAPR